MPNKYKLLLTFLSLTLLSAWLLSPTVFAEKSLGVSATVPIEGNDGKQGDIVSYNDGKYVLSTGPYDLAMYGVITNNAVISIQDLDISNENPHQVISFGEAVVNVSSIAGNIKRGDSVTSSLIPGVGQLAEKSGQVIGRALEDYSSDDPKAVGTILVFVDIKSAYIDSNLRVNLIEALRTGAAAPFLTPVTSLRYILAALVVGAAFVIGFSSFGRASGSSIEALGRNPLAKKTIRSAVVFNFLLTFGVMVLGIIFSYLILVL